MTTKNNTELDKTPLDANAPSGLATEPCSPVKSDSFNSDLKALMDKYGASFRIETDENGGVSFTILNNEDEQIYNEVNCCGLTITEYNF